MPTAAWQAWHVFDWSGYPRDSESQSFITKVPFGTGEPAADVGKEVA